MCDITQVEKFQKIFEDVQRVIEMHNTTGNIPNKLALKNDAKELANQLGFVDFMREEFDDLIYVCVSVAFPDGVSSVDLIEIPSEETLYIIENADIVYFRDTEKEALCELEVLEADIYLDNLNSLIVSDKVFDIKEFLKQVCEH